MSLSSGKRQQARLEDIPDASCVTTDSGKVYYMTRGKLMEIPSEAVRQSWTFPTTFYAPQRIIDNYPKHESVLGFRPGTVVASISDRCFYYIDMTGARRKIVDPKFFKEAGISRLNVEIVSKKDIERHKPGEDIT